jgi:hypothetical protein
VQHSEEELLYSQAALPLMLMLAREIERNESTRSETSFEREFGEIPEICLWRAFLPLTDCFILAPDGSFVGAG